MHFFKAGLQEGAIAGAFVENYLLEKSRVVAQMQPGERSYHIFYQLCRSSWAPALSLQAAPRCLLLTTPSRCRSLARAPRPISPALPSLPQDPEAFTYLAKSGCSTVSGVDDAAEMEEVLQALHAMSFAHEATLWMFSLCACVLHLGNLSFQPVDQGEGSAVDAASQEWLGLAAHYLQARSRLDLALISH